MAKVFVISFSEWDLGFNIDGYRGAYTSEEARTKALNKVDWSQVEYTCFQDAIDDGLLTTMEVIDE